LSLTVIKRTGNRKRSQKRVWILKKGRYLRGGHQLTRPSKAGGRRRGLGEGRRRRERNQGWKEIFLYRTLNLGGNRKGVKSEK